MTGKKWLLCTFFQMVADRKPKPLNTPGCVFVKKKSIFKHRRPQDAFFTITKNEQRTSRHGTKVCGYLAPWLDGWLCLWILFVCGAQLNCIFHLPKKEKILGGAKQRWILKCSSVEQQILEPLFSLIVYILVHSFFPFLSLLFFRLSKNGRQIEFNPHFAPKIPLFLHCKKKYIFEQWAKEALAKVTGILARQMRRETSHWFHKGVQDLGILGSPDPQDTPIELGEFHSPAICEWGSIPTASFLSSDEAAAVWVKKSTHSGS